MKRELEGGWFQWMALPLPALLTIQSGINQLRYATLKGIMAAKKKEIRKVAAGAPVEPPAHPRCPLPRESEADADDSGSAAEPRKSSSRSCATKRG